MRITYLGTAMLLIEVGGKRLVTDPALDPAGTKYDFGPWYTPASWFASEKTYETPMDATALGSVDAVLISHDHHADNLDTAGHRFIESPQVARIITTTHGTKRLALGERVTPLAWGASTTLGDIEITATPARHGPHGTPKIHQVIGFILEAPNEPTLWISGDTVWFPALADALTPWRGKIDTAVVHCGGVNFPTHDPSHRRCSASQAMIQGAHGLRHAASISGRDP